MSAALEAHDAARIARECRTALGLDAGRGPEATAVRDVYRAARDALDRNYGDTTTVQLGDVPGYSGRGRHTHAPAAVFRAALEHDVELGELRVVGRAEHRGRRGWVVTDR